MPQEHPSLALFHPIIRQWFAEELGPPTDAQRQAWPAIASGQHVLLTAPTGSGKTLAAFLWPIHQLLTGAWEPGRVRVVYVSPLKNWCQALGIDNKNHSPPFLTLVFLPISV